MKCLLRRTNLTGVCLIYYRYSKSNSEVAGLAEEIKPRVTNETPTCSYRQKGLRSS